MPLTESQVIEILNNYRPVKEKYLQAFEDNEEFRSSQPEIFIERNKAVNEEYESTMERKEFKSLLIELENFPDLEKKVKPLIEQLY